MVECTFSESGIPCADFSCGTLYPEHALLILFVPAIIIIVSIVLIYIKKKNT